MVSDLRRRRRSPDPARARRDADAYERIVAGLDRGVVFVPDQEAREAVEAIALSTDEQNDYATVVVEHAALDGLLARLRGVPGDAAPTEEESELARARLPLR